MKKNLTPLQLAIYASLTISFLIILILSVIIFFIPYLNWIVLPVILPLSLIISFLIIYYVLNVFIYRKIKLIYKSIHTLKSGAEKKSKNIDLKSDVIGDIEDQVANWAIEYQAELSELKRMEKYRREFLGNVSHELKSPLFNVQGYIDTLVDGKLQDNEINLKYLEKASKNIAQIANIISDLEVISAIESGELPFIYTIFDITALIKEVIESFELQTRYKNISISIKEGCNTPFNVFADRERIKRVIINLVSNSLKYGIQGGKTMIGIYDMAENILIEVSDNGIGIEQEHLARLFERFYRVDKSRDRKEGSSGLGLAIVKHIIEAHGQTINVRSSPGKGSSFGFTLKKGVNQL